VAVNGFDGGTVTVNFADPDGGPTCDEYVTANGGGNPGCDLQPGWSVVGRDGGDVAEVTILDITIAEFDISADTVSVIINDPDETMTFGCNGSVAIAYESDVDDAPTATRMVAKAGESVVDFSTPGGCPGSFDNATADLTSGSKVYLTAWETDGDRTLEVRPVGAAFTCPDGATPFDDVAPTSFAYDDISCIYGLGLTNGTSPTTFGTDQFVTREQMAAFLARLARLFGTDVPGATHPFTDVSPNSFGVTKGTGDGSTYSPTDYVTREQMASFLARLYSVVFGSPSSPVLALVVPTPFSDVAPDSFALADIGRIYGLDLTSGTGPTTYAPDTHVTREQMAAFLARLIRILHHT
jgi:hypothetical protein